ncbi:vanadium-dependent haloperoxidase [Flavobacteriaceae bacterium LMO-SS05]
MNTKWVATSNARMFNIISPYRISWYSALSISIFLLVFSCAKNDDLETMDNDSLIAAKIISKNQSPDMVLAWNKAMQDLYTFPLNEGTPPVSTSYTWALVHLAMHDALNSITPRYETYGVVTRDKNADPNAAVAQAAYDVIMAVKNLPFSIAYVPQNLESINTLLETSLGSIPEGEAKNKGIALGHAVAQAILAKRASDFLNLVPASPNQPLEGTQPGEYRYLPFAPAPNGYGYAFPNFGFLVPFFMPQNDMFRPGPPYPINSAEYTTDFNEVKLFGDENSTVRTADQTESGVFWAENSNRGWNEIARQILESYNPKSQNAWKTARYLALIHGAIADSYISIFESKRYYYTWRPIQAIQLANTDGNDHTVSDPNWKPLLTTPPIGEYPSAHAISGATAGQIMFRYFDDKDNYVIHHNSGYLPGVIRTYSSISDAIRENSLSRIYIGYHFRQAIDVGEYLGKDLGDYVYENALKERF